MKADFAFELTRAWGVLREAQLTRQRGGDVNVLAVDAAGFPLPAWAGTGNGRQATFLIETTSRPELPVAESEILSVTYEMLEARGKYRQFVSLACNRMELEPVFAELCSDLARRVAAGSGISAALASTLAEFRSLLQKPREALGEEQLIGLIGELIVLEKLLSHDKTAVAGWVGAQRTRHDFRSGTKAIEVKSSLRKQTRSISINALDQLVPPNDGELYLAYVRLERDPAGTEGLAGICQRIRQRCDPEVTELFDARIGMVAGKPLPSVAREGFSIMEFSAYRITDCFPALVPVRLVKGRPDPGISNVSYQLDLSAAEDFRLLPEQWDRLLVEWGADGS